MTSQRGTFLLRFPLVGHCDVTDLVTSLYNFFIAIMRNLKYEILSQVKAVPSPTTGLCEVEIPLPQCYFTHSSLAGSQPVTVSFRRFNSNLPLGTLGTVAVYPENKVQLSHDDVYAILPSRVVYVGGAFRFVFSCWVYIYIDVRTDRIIG